MHAFSLLLARSLLWTCSSEIAASDGDDVFCQRPGLVLTQPAGADVPQLHEVALSRAQTSMQLSVVAWEAAKSAATASLLFGSPAAWNGISQQVRRRLASEVQAVARPNRDQPRAQAKIHLTHHTQELTKMQHIRMVQ